MKCERYEQLISQLVDRQISKADEKKLKKHLVDCQKCLKFFTKLETVDKVLGKTKTPQVKRPVIQYSNKSFAFKLVTAGSTIVGILLVFILLSPFFLRTDVEKDKKDNISYSKKPSVLNLFSRDDGSGEVSGLRLLPGKREPAKEQPMLISQKEIEIQVVDIDKSCKTIRGLIKQSGGYVQSTEFQRNDSDIPTYAYLVVKIPVDRFDKTFKEVEKLGGVKSMNESTEDVTLEYIDNKARLKNLRLQEKRYQVLLDRAGSVNDILSIEGRLSSVRQKIEQIQSRVKYLEKAVSYVSLDISLTKKTSGIKWNIFTHLTQSVQNAIDSAGFLIRATGSLLPLLILGLVILFGVRFYKNRK